MSREPAYLGRGWGFPPAFGPGGRDVVMAEGIDDIRESLRIVLLTERNERVMRPDFGCSLRRFAFESVDRKLLTDVSAAVSDAITYHEPRIELEGVDVIPDQDQPGLLLVSIRYAVRGSNSRYNLVLPYWISDAIGVPP